MGAPEMTKRRSCPLRDRRGSVSLEFAVVAIPFVVLMMLIVGASMLFWSKSVLQMAAARTARCVAIGSLDCTYPTPYVNAMLADWGVGGLLPSVVVTVATGQTCGLAVGHYASVSITTPSGSAGAIAPGFSGVVLNATACHPSGI